MSPPNRILCNLVFGKDGNAETYQSGAWSDAEDGHTWSLAPACALTIPVTDPADDVVLVLDVWPETAPPARPVRTMFVQREGRALAKLELARRGVFCIPIGSAGAGTEIWLSFVFDAPVDGVAGDDRPLAFAFRSLRMIARDEPASVKRMTKPPLIAMDIAEPDARWKAEALFGEPLAEALTRFESLGHTCDFAFFQRQCGAEPLGLLRFAGIPIPGLVDGLIDGFAQLGRPGSLAAIADAEREGEYQLQDRLYGLAWYTNAFAGQVGPEEVVEREAWRLPFLKRHFLETLEAGDKIFVLRPPRTMDFAEADAIVTALRLHSNCMLLWAVQEQGEPGAVDIMRRYFFRGHLDVAARRGSSSVQAWLSVCANMRSAW